MSDDNLPTVRAGLPVDPSRLGWPETLAWEVALRTQPLQNILDAYGITAAEWVALVDFPPFIAELKSVQEQLKDEGMNFKMRAKIQSLALLQDSWGLIHDGSGDVPAAVKADLIKSTVRWAGYDGKDASQKDGPDNAFQINITLPERYTEEKK